MALVEHPILVERLAARVESPQHGAVTTFTGLVRNHHAGRGVTRLEYSAYSAMAEGEIASIVAEAESRFGALVAVEHRIGTLEVGEVAVGVAAAAAHRGPSFEACRYVIEELKRRVPIWKKEHYADGSLAWVDPTSPQER